MTINKNYTVKFRRHRLRKTDYNTRLRLLLSKKNRLVIRKTLNKIYLQIVSYKKSGDNIILSFSSEILKKYGWKYKLNNLPACYLTGLLLGLKAKKQKITNLILDMGLRTSVKGSSIYAALKGLIDSGITLPYSEKILPDEHRIKGEHILNYALFLKKQPEKYKKQFSSYLKNNVNAEDIVKNFEEIKQKILNEYKNG